MKKIIKYTSILVLLMPMLFLSACTNNTTENLAKDLDTTINNLVVTVSTLDWPQDEDLENFNNILAEKNTTTNTNSSLAVDTQIDTTEIYTWLENVHSKINLMFSKRSDLLMYLNEIYGGNTNLSEENILSIKVYMNILKDNSNYLNSYNGMLKNQINEAKEIYDSNANVNLINAYLIKAVETLQLRCAKIDTSILATTSIIDIIKNNLINNYYTYNEHQFEAIENEEEQASNNTTADQSDNQEQEDTQEEIIIENEQNLPITEEITEEKIVNEAPTQTEENAINFESEVTEVESVEEQAPIATNTEELKYQETPNYDNLIKTLEEPMVDDEQSTETSADKINETKEEPINKDLPVKEQTKNTEEFNKNKIENLQSTETPNNNQGNLNNQDSETTNIKDEESEDLQTTTTKNIKETDKDFAQEPLNENTEKKVTREIIKEKNI